MYTDPLVRAAIRRQRIKHALARVEQARAVMLPTGRCLADDRREAVAPPRPVLKHDVGCPDRLGRTIREVRTLTIRLRRLRFLTGIRQARQRVVLGYSFGRRRWRRAVLVGGCSAWGGAVYMGVGEGGCVVAGMVGRGVLVGGMVACADAATNGSPPAMPSARSPRREKPPANVITPFLVPSQPSVPVKYGESV